MTRSARGRGSRPAAFIARPSTAFGLGFGDVGAEREAAVDLGGIGFELRVALLHRPQELDDRVGDRALERAVLLAVELLLDVGDRLRR